MNITPTTTVSELLHAGFTLTSPYGFELRGRPDDGSIGKRSPTPAGMTAAGHNPLGTMGIYTACTEVNDYAEMCVHEGIQPFEHLKTCA